MAFVLPTFPITCNVYNKGSFGVTPPRIANVPCQLRAPAAAYGAVIVVVAGQTIAMTLLVGAGVDIRDRFNTPINSEDWVECPSGSGRVYVVAIVDDIAKGFPNEHRYAILQKVTGIPWPTPTP